MRRWTPCPSAWACPRPRDLRLGHTALPCAGRLQLSAKTARWSLDKRNQQEHLLCLTMVEQGNYGYCHGFKEIHWPWIRMGRGSQKILGRWPWAPSAQKEWNEDHSDWAMRWACHDVPGINHWPCLLKMHLRYLSHFLHDPCGSFRFSDVICSLPAAFFSHQPTARA